MTSPDPAISLHLLRWTSSSAKALSCIKAAVCCANPPLFREYVNRLFAYTQSRTSRVGETV